MLRQMGDMPAGESSGHKIRVKKTHVENEPGGFRGLSAKHAAPARGVSFERCVLRHCTVSAAPFQSI